MCHSRSPPFTPYIAAEQKKGYHSFVEKIETGMAMQKRQDNRSGKLPLRSNKTNKRH
ncbi:hypothetical protein B4099_0862 [Heyndrickxia coagulans]|uniref:Uncharacterized protein n=1 Tax=Heyndrickxia coagulans TaxID=1398 RepID=A0A150KED2_HEYCO|nr:hypothetical protein B4099_0862 [Heyndrickxia coagulans]